jgi:arylformamidase
MQLTEDFCNREYNARASIPEHPEIFARWAEAGRDVRRRSAGLLDLAFGSSPKERLDLFPASGHGAPLLVFIHGGYWRSLDKSDFSWVAPPFVERGVSVALVNYDLAPAVSVETITLQVVRALEWLWRSAERYGYDPARIHVCGHSAGGHLTAMALCALWPQWDPDLPADLVRSGVAISGLYDLEPVRRASFVNVDLKLDERSALRLSPAWMRPATDAPLVTAVGALESSEFRRQNALIAERWKANHRADVPMPGSNHLTVVDALADPANALFRATLDLCRE